MASKFEQFLKDNKIDPRRLLIASKKLEQLRPEDRAARLSRRRAKGGAKPEAKEGEESSAPKKPRSGRPVTPRLVQAASVGKPLTGPAKSRILRAVNHLLTQKKKEPVELRTLF